MGRGKREHGSKTGMLLSNQYLNLARKERIEKLTMEAQQALNQDVYMMRNHLGTFDCKLCLTTHKNEGNYLVHTRGKKHLMNLEKRRIREQIMEERKAEIQKETTQSIVPEKKDTSAAPVVKIGTPGYDLIQQRHAETNQRILLFRIHYPQLDSGEPKYRFMSAFEQQIDYPQDNAFMYILFAAGYYETIGFKIPNLPLDVDKFYEKWNANEKVYVLQLVYANEN